MRYGTLRLAALATLALVLAAATAPARAADDAKPDAEGFVTQWLMLGPIPNGDDMGAEALDKKQIADEGALKPKAGDKQKVGAKELTWKAVRQADKEFFVDLAANVEANGPTEDVTGYLVAYVIAPEEMKDVTLVMCSNDQGKLFVNGAEIVKSAEGRSIDKDGDKKPGVTLKKGVNVIVLKVVNEKNNWQGAVRLLDKADKPVTNVVVRTEP